MSTSLSVQVRQMLTDTMQQVVDRVTGNRVKAYEVLSERADLTQHECYQATVKHYRQNCFNWHNPEVGLHRQI